jgi:ABC-2 type transport system permease protein
VRRSELLLAQVLSRLVFTWVMVAGMLVFARLSFGVRVHGSLLDVVIVVLAGGAAFSGIGLLVGARVRTMETGQAVLTIVGLPMLLLSDVFFSSTGFPVSTSGMPPWLRQAASVLPLTAFNDGLRAVMNEAAPLPLGDILLLLAWGAVPFAVAVRTFRWK